MRYDNIDNCLGCTLVQPFDHLIEPSQTLTKPKIMYLTLPCNNLD